MTVDNGTRRHPSPRSARRLPIDVVAPAIFIAVVLVSLLVGLIINAVLLRAAVYSCNLLFARQWEAPVSMPSFSYALLVVIAVGLMNTLFGYLLGTFVGLIGVAANASIESTLFYGGLANFALGIVFASSIYAMMLSITWRRALLITLAIVAFWLVIIGVLLSAAKLYELLLCPASVGTGVFACAR